MNIFKNKNEKWCYEFICNGHRVRRICGLSRPEAEQAAVIEYQKIKRERFGLAQPHKNIRFEDFSTEFLEVYSKKNKRSWTRDETALNNLKPFFKGRFLTEIGPEMVEKYKAKRINDGVSPATTNREVSILKTMFNKAVEWDRIEINPISKVKKFREPNGRERILSDDEMRRLVEGASGHLKAVLIIALNTGMRRSEILSLKWRDVNFGQQSIYIADSKSGRCRKVPMNGMVIETLREFTRSPEFIFMNGGTEHIKDVKTAFHSACRRAEINGVRFHDLRHTAASKMIEAGADVVSVSKILGHADLRMTLRYCHPTDATMQGAVARVAEIFGKHGKKPAIEAGQAISYKPVTHSVHDN